MRDTLRDVARRQPRADNDFRDSADDEKTEVDSQRGLAHNDYNDEKGAVSTPTDSTQDDPFGDDSNSETQYRTLSWWQAAIIMIAETISLGILSLPSVLATIGIVPGVILIVGLGVIATYTGYVIWQFKMRYPFVHSMADAGWVLCKPLGCPRVGREIGGAAQTIFLIFGAGSHILTWTIALNTITDSATCTIVWSVVALVLLWILTQPRTLKKVSWFSIASFISIFAAVMIAMIDLGISPAGTGLAATVAGPFNTAFLAVTDVVFAYAGHVAFFSFISELKDPNDFPKSLILLQVGDVTMYTVVAAVVYRFAGPDVDSPALGSAGEVAKKVAYGIAIPTILVAAVIYGHVATKYVYVRIFRGTRHLGANTFYSIGTWAAISLVFWLIAWVLAESIPDFNDLLSLISSLFAAHFTLSLSGTFWLFMNWGHWFDGWKKSCLTVINFLIFLIGWGVCGMGLYASGYAINKGAKSSSSWTCASNGQ